MNVNELHDTFDDTFEQFCQSCQFMALSVLTSFISAVYDPQTKSVVGKTLIIENSYIPESEFSLPLAKRG